MTKSQRFINLVREKFFPKMSETAVLERLRPGHWQRSAGAWVWSISDRANGSILEIGGQDPVTKLLKCPTLEVYSGVGGTEIMCNCKGKCKGENKCQKK